MSKLLPKHRFEEIKKAQRQAKLDKRRKIAVRNVSVSFLIVCEGERTEPNYFKALIKDRYSDIREVTIEGKGQGTVSLIKETMAIRNKSNKEFDRVWAVFDKDDFNDFNDAIRLAHKNHILCVWSNESFELWYYLHFQYLDTGISRAQYIEKIEREVQNKTNDTSYRYKKKSPETFDILQRIGNESLAIKYAQRLRESFSGTDYASHKPCTTVYELVEELTHPEKLL